jgi:hypothetical protein
MRRGLLVGLLAVALLTPARGAILEEFAVEDWSGLALSDDATGRLASCAIYSKYQNGATLFFIRHVDGNWTLSLVHDTWALTENSEQPARYKVDREPFVDALAVALDKDQMGIALSADDPLITGVRRGKLLTVVFQGKEYGFELSNSRKAMDGAAECIARHRETVGPKVAEPPAPPQEPAGAPGAQADTAVASPPQQDTGPADTPGDASEASPIGERQTFGPWVVTATDDGAGKFVNCTAFGCTATISSSCRTVRTASGNSGFTARRGRST